MIVLTEHQLVPPQLVADESIASTISLQLHAHRRDIDLFGRLFSSWSCGQRRQHSVVNEALDGIDEQLAQLERAVTMRAVS